MASLTRLASWIGRSKARCSQMAGVKGMYPLRACVQAYTASLKRPRANARPAMTKLAQESLEIKNALARAKLAVLTFEAKVREGALIPVDERNAENFIMREHLLSWAGALPQKLEGLTLHQMTEVIKVEVHRVLTELSVGGDANFGETVQRMFRDTGIEADENDRAILTQRFYDA
jgi:hypothetical protein